MANSRFTLLPYAAEFPSTAFPQLMAIHSTERRAALAFDASTVESCRWTFVAPQGLTGTMNAIIYYCMASATADSVNFEVSIEAVTTEDALDLDAATSFDTMNDGHETVPGTAGYMSLLAVALTNADSMAAGDLVRLKLERDADDGTDDTATGDAYVLAVEFRDAV